MAEPLKVGERSRETDHPVGLKNLGNSKYISNFNKFFVACYFNSLV